MITAPNGGADFVTNVAAQTLSGTCAADTNAILVNGSALDVTYTPGSTTWSYGATLVAGANLYSVTARNLATNESGADTMTITLDNVPPVITLAGSAAMTVEVKTSFTDPGATATDNYDTTVTVNVSGAVNINMLGNYVLTYSAHDSSSNAAVPKTRTVHVADTTAPADPVITAPNGGADLATNVAAQTLSGTCAADTNAILVNGSALGVTYTPGGTTWSYDATLSPGANAFSVTAQDLLSNESGADTMTITLDAVAPAITMQPVGGSAYVGDSFAFVVAASGGVPPLSYQWRHNGSDISGATSMRIVRALLILGDAGDYDCVVTNSGGVGSTTSDLATLSVADHLQITTPQGADLRLGAPYILFVETEGGHLSLAYQWIKDGTLLSGATTSSYEITSFAEADAGMYTVEISDNLTDTITSAPPALLQWVGELPVASPAGLAAAVLATGLLGALRLRRRKE